MIKIAIVEDEKRFMDELLEYLEQYQKVIGKEFDISLYRDGDEITKGYKAQFDVILMDIQMKFIDGMTAAKEIRKVDSEVVIMFITNMSQYAIKGYEVDALDYILKPITYFSFCQKLGKAISKIKNRTTNYIMIQNKSEALRINIEDIYFIESKAHNLIYHTAIGEYVVPGTMKETEEKLAPYGFSRGNSCYLIHLKHVDSIRDKCAVVRGEALALSRPRYKEFMQSLTKYWGGI